MALVQLARFDEALSRQTEAVTLIRSLRGECSVEHLNFVLNRALLQRACGDHEAAIASLNSIAVRAATLVAPPWQVWISAAEYLAWMLADQGNGESALNSLGQAEELRDRWLQCVLAAGTDVERLRAAAIVRDGCGFSVSLLLTYFRDMSDIGERVLTTILGRKALGIELPFRASFAHPFTTKPKRSFWNRIWKRQLEAGKTPGQWENDLRTHAFHAQPAPQRDLESVLSFWRLGGIGTVNLAKLRRSLPPSVALIEFLRFARFDFRSAGENLAPATRTYHVLAVVLAETENLPPQIIEFGEADILDARCEAFLCGLTSKRRTESRGLVADTPEQSADLSASDDLCEMLVKPLTAALPDHHRWVVAPDGVLSLIPFDCLPGTDGSKFLADSKTITYVESGRQLLGVTTDTTTRRRALVIADPDFDAAPVNLRRVLSSRAGVARSGIFPPLPGTALEGALVARRLRAKLARGRRAVAALLRGDVPEVLHIATHAYAANRNASLTAIVDSATDPDPFLQCGLAFAGANRAEWQNDNCGVMTAAEIANLDLSRTQLCVLSACETGAGKVLLGEGVLGLRRAFILAGAKAVLVSLWKVADLPTAILMIRFYEEWIENSRTFAAALATARTYLRTLSVETLRRDWLNTPLVKHLASRDAAFANYLNQFETYADVDRPFAHPYFWGGFILIISANSLTPHENGCPATRGVGVSGQKNP